jgi:hypothetical protein
LKKTLQANTPVKTIYFSSSGLLYKINLAAIPINDELTMGEKYQIVMLNSTRMLAEKKEAMLYNENDAAIFGGVKYDADSTFLVNAAAKGTTKRYCHERVQFFHDNRSKTARRNLELPKMDRERSKFH